MKLNTDLNIEVLEKYGFEKLDDVYKENYNVDDSDNLYFLNGYIYTLGHSRRGQFYYLLCSFIGDFSIYASKPDGSGGALNLSDPIFLNLIKDGIIV